MYLSRVVHWFASLLFWLPSLVLLVYLFSKRAMAVRKSMWIVCVCQWCNCANANTYATGGHSCKVHARPILGLRDIRSFFTTHTGSRRENQEQHQATQTMPVMQHAHKKLTIRGRLCWDPTISKGAVLKCPRCDNCKRVCSHWGSAIPFAQIAVFHHEIRQLQKVLTFCESLLIRHKLPWSCKLPTPRFVAKMMMMMLGKNSQVTSEDSQSRDHEHKWCHQGLDFVLQCHQLSWEGVLNIGNLQLDLQRLWFLAKLTALSTLSEMISFAKPIGNVIDAASLATSINKICSSCSMSLCSVQLWC